MRKSWLLAAVLGISTISAGTTAMAVQNDDTGGALAALMARLQGGPVLLTPDEPFKAHIGLSDAIKSAGQALGVQGAPAHVWKMVVTDAEFIGDLLKKRHCYVVEYVTRLSEAPEPTIEQPDSVYVVIDATSGQCWEIFTRPETAWWKRVSYGGHELVQRLAKGGQKGAAPESPPQVSLRTTLHELLKASPGGAAAIADQIIARYFLYTTADEGRQIKRVNGTEIIPLYARRPIWYISFEGSQLPAPQRDGRPKLEEWTDLYDARTAKGLRSEASR